MSFTYEDTNGTVMTWERHPDGSATLQTIVYAGTPLESRSVPVEIASGDLAAVLDGMRGETA